MYFIIFKNIFARYIKWFHSILVSISMEDSTSFSKFQSPRHLWNENRFMWHLKENIFIAKLQKKKKEWFHRKKRNLTSVKFIAIENLKTFSITFDHNFKNCLHNLFLSQKAWISFTKCQLINHNSKFNFLVETEDILIVCLEYVCKSKSSSIFSLN